MKDVFEAVRDLAAAGERGALATVVGTSGSTPGKEAMRMLVPEDGRPVGTVGGGGVEAAVEEEARAVLAGAPGRLLDYVMTEDAGLLCGGRIEVLVTPVEPGRVWAAAIEARTRGDVLCLRISGDDAGRLAVVGDGVAGSRTLAAAASLLVEKVRSSGHAARGSVEIDGTEHDVYAEPLAHPTLWIFGGGHVSLELARIAPTAGFRVGVVDDREEFANPERFPMAFATVCGPMPACLERVPTTPDDSLVVVTRGHREDETALRWALGRPARSIGLIGSRSKVTALFARLRADGVPDETLAGIRAPVGLDLGARTAGEIAVAIVAELIAIRRRGVDDLSVGRPLRAVRGPFADG